MARGDAIQTLRVLALHLPVQVLAVRMREIDFAAYLEHGRSAGFQPTGDAADGPGIRRHILPDMPVPPRGRLDQLSVLVAQGKRDAVYLGFCTEGNRSIAIQTQESARSLDKIAHIIAVEGVLQREKRPPVLDGGKSPPGTGTYRACRRIRAREVRKPALQGLDLLPEPVIFSVADLRIVAVVIRLVVAANLVGKPRVLNPRFMPGEPRQPLLQCVSRFRHAAFSSPEVDTLIRDQV